MVCPQRRQSILSVRPPIFSSAIWYLALQLGQRNFIRGGSSRREESALEQAHQVVFDPPLRLVVRSVAEGPLPDLDRAVLEPCSLVENRQVLQRSEVSRRQIHRRL